MTMTVVKRDDSQDHLSDDAVNELGTKLGGQLVVCDDPEARTEPLEVWNAMHVARPGRSGTRSTNLRSGQPSESTTSVPDQDRARDSHRSWTAQ